jgi:hypothetical protein
VLRLWSLHPVVGLASTSGSRRIGRLMTSRAHDQPQRLGQQQHRDGSVAARRLVHW